MYGIVILSVVSIVMVISFWLIFQKSGRPGWYSLIPLWNVVAMLDAAGKSPWWAVFIVVVSRIFSILIPGLTLGTEIFADLAFLLLIISVGFVEKFKSGIWLSLGIILIPVVFYPLLAFGKYEYEPEEYGYYEDDK